MLSSVHNMVSVLRAFRIDRPEMSLAELARVVHLPKSTANKLVQTLLAQGFLDRMPGRARYRPSLRMFELSHFILRHLDMVREATPFIRRLVELTGQTAHLSTYENGEVIWLLRIDGPSSSELYSRVGRRGPAMAAAAGRAILAFLDPAEIDHAISRGWRKLTVRTTADRDKLLRDLAVVRQNGYAFQAGEVDVGIASVGAPVFDHQQRPVASVSAAGPSEWFTPETVRRVGALAQQTALAISRRIGYGGGASAAQRGGIRSGIEQQSGLAGHCGEGAAPVTPTAPPLVTAAHALSLLGLFDDANPELGVSEMGRRLALPKSVVSRMVATFVADGVLEQDELTRRCRLGPLLLELGLIAAQLHPVLSAAGPTLERMRDITGQNAELWLPDGNEVLCLASHRGGQALSGPTAPGTRVDRDRRVAGLAAQAAVWDAAHMGAGAEPVCMQEPANPGTQTAACAVVDAAGCRAVIALSAPVSWFGGLAADSLRDLLRDAAREASRRLAGLP